MGQTRDLAQFIVDTTYNDLPAEVVDRMRLYVLDNLACGVAGSDRPEPRMVADFAQAAKASPDCSVFGGSWQTSASLAALVNGVAIGALEADHGYLPGSCHPGAAVFPAAVALGEREELGGKSFLTALVVGYEALCRIGLAATRSVEDVRGFHGPGTNAAFGAAAAVSNLLGLDAGATAHALGIAGSHGGSLLEFKLEGAMTKRLHVGRGSQMGLEAALFASMGMSGPTTVLEGAHGFLNAYAVGPKPDEITDCLGREWRMLDLLTRPFACHGSFHGAVHAVDRFRRRHKPDPRKIRSIAIKTSEATITKHGEKRPTTVMGMQYSLPFTLATALARDVGDPRIFCEDAVGDATIRRLAEQVQLTGIPVSAPHGGYQDPYAEIDLIIDGEQHHVVADGYVGHPGTPMQWTDAVEKFRRFAETVVGTQAVALTVDRVASLEEAGGLTALLADLRRSPEGGA